MRIPIGRKYVITSDSFCITLNERVVGKKGKAKGKERLVPVSFYNTIEACLEGLLNQKIRESDATSMRELIDEVKEANKFIRDEFQKARDSFA